MEEVGYEPSHSLCA